MAVMHSFGLEDHYTSKIFAKGLKSGKNEDEKSFNVSRTSFQSQLTFRPRWNVNRKKSVLRFPLARC